MTTVASPGFWFGGNQRVTAHKALLKGVAGGLKNFKR